MEEQETLSALRVENARLIALLEVHGIDWRQSVPRTPTPSKCEVEPSKLSINEKITLFRSLFRGRSDVFADVTFIDDEYQKEPWKSSAALPRKLDEPMPSSITITQANLLYFEKAQLPQSLANRLIRLAAFQNPEFYKAQAMRLPVWNKPRAICCGEKSVVRKTFRTI